MTAAVTLGGFLFNTIAGTGAGKTVTLTPAVGDLLVIVVANTGNTTSAAPTDDQGGTYTFVTSAAKNTSADLMEVWVRTALIPAAVSTVVTHIPGTTTGGGLVVMQVANMTRAGSAAILQSGSQANQAAAGTPTVALGGAMSTLNAGIGAVFNETNPATVTARTGWTGAGNTGYALPTTGLEVMRINSGETASSLAWGSASATQFSAVAVEFDTSTTTALMAVSASGSAGTVAPESSVALTATTGTGAAGTVAPAISGALSGATGTGSVGSTGVAVTVALTGNTATGTAGNVSVGGDVTLALTGVTATGSVGTVVPRIPAVFVGGDSDDEKKKRKKFRNLRDEIRTGVLAAFDDVTAPPAPIPVPIPAQIKVAAQIPAARDEARTPPAFDEEDEEDAILLLLHA